jgi:hypothetical protein
MTVVTALNKPKCHFYTDGIVFEKSCMKIENNINLKLKYYVIN